MRVSYQGLIDAGTEEVCPTCAHASGHHGGVGVDCPETSRIKANAPEQNRECIQQYRRNSWGQTPPQPRQRKGMVIEQERTKRSA